jgi:hypothetical protein
VPTLLIDANLDVHAELLAIRLGTDTWREMRERVPTPFLGSQQQRSEDPARIGFTHLPYD